MSEEEIINRINKLFKDNEECFENIGTFLNLDGYSQRLMQNLLDLYNKEKEKNIKLQKRNDRQVKIINKRDKNIAELKEIANKDWEERCRLTFELENYISKDKIREKINKYNEIRQKTNDDDVYYAMVNYIDILEELLEEE